MIKTNFKFVRIAISFFLILKISTYDECTIENEKFKDRFICNSEDPIGKGGFGTVYDVLIKSTKTRSALKVQDDNRYFPDAAVNQVKALKSIKDHSHVVKFFNFFKDNSKCYLFLEFLEGENLYTTFNNNSKKKMFEDPDFVLSLIYQIASGLKAIHDSGYVHADIKLENVVLTKDNIAKIVDFDTVVEIGKRATFRGTPIYISPEVLLEKKNDPYFTEKVDVYSLGVILYELTQNGNSVFPKGFRGLPDESSLIKGEYFITVPTHPVIIYLIQKMLKIDPSERFSISEIQDFINEVFREKINPKVVAPKVTLSNRCFESISIIQYLPEKYKKYEKKDKKINEVDKITKNIPMKEKSQIKSNQTGFWATLGEMFGCSSRHLTII